MVKILREFGKAFFIGFLVFLILFTITYLNGGRYKNFEHVLLDFGYNQLYSVVLYCGNAFYFYYLMKTYQSNIFQLKNLALGVLGAMFITVACIFLLRLFTETLFEGETFIEFLQGETLNKYYISFIISIVVTSVFYFVYYYRHKQENRVKEQKIIAGNASAKFDALKNQLDPHFLFNSLNVLTSLIEENPEAATKFTTALSKVYRYVLEQKNKDLVTLEEELKFAQLYMSLINMRFEDSIVFKMPTTLKNPLAKVVPLALQLLLENAVKHNQLTPSKKLFIEIEELEDSLLITNNLQAKQVIKESSGVGLRNIIQRYKMLTKEPVLIVENRSQFSITIPLLKKETTILQTQDTFISEKRYSSAKKRVEKLKGFYIHLTVYLIMVPVFIWFNYLSQIGFPWAIFPIVGWGFGITGHASETFGYHPFFGKDWEAKKIQKLMEKEDK